MVIGILLVVGAFGVGVGVGVIAGLLLAQWLELD